MADKTPPMVAADRWLAEQGDVQRERQNYAGANYHRAYDQPMGKRGHCVSALIGAGRQGGEERTAARWQ
jgi:hypothetical protein